MVLQRMIDFTKRTGKKSEGFTLVELLIVVAIIAILAAIAIPQFSKYRLRAYKTALDSDAKNMYTAAQAYLTDFPATAIVTAQADAILKTGGYNASAGVTTTFANMTLSLGHINIKTSAGALADNNTVIYHNGRIVYANNP